MELRRRRLTQARIAASLGISKSTVGRVLARAGLSLYAMAIRFTPTNIKEWKTLRLMRITTFV